MRTKAQIEEDGGGEMRVKRSVITDEHCCVERKSKISRFIECPHLKCWGIWKCLFTDDFVDLSSDKDSMPFRSQACIDRNFEAYVEYDDDK